MTGRFLLFSNSNVASTTISFPRAFRKDFVHAVFRGLRFFMKFFTHFDRQNLKTCKYKHVNMRKLFSYKQLWWFACFLCPFWQRVFVIRTDHPPSLKKGNSSLCSTRCALDRLPWNHFARTAIRGLGKAAHCKSSTSQRAPWPTEGAISLIFQRRCDETMKNKKKKKRRGESRRSDKPEMH